MCENKDVLSFHTIKSLLNYGSAL